MEPERVPVEAEHHIVTARQRARTMAAELGFGVVDQTQIAAAVSELTRNIVLYAEAGEVLLSVVEQSPGRVRALQIVVRDRGPGIQDTDLAMRDGWSSSEGLGLGLPGTQRLMDFFELNSKAGVGTTITVRKTIP
ncbi:MAG: anti-sigma regulatory factor [Myxococcales bacterium]|nr:anti-sigma regulatory factor [Myxococcales bacterium]